MVVRTYGGFDCGLGLGAFPECFSFGFWYDIVVLVFGCFCRCWGFGVLAFWVCLWCGRFWWPGRVVVSLWLGLAGDLGGCGVFDVWGVLCVFPGSLFSGVWA